MNTQTQLKVNLDAMILGKKAGEIRRRMRSLYDLGDCAIEPEGWTRTDQELIDRYSWTLGALHRWMVTEEIQRETDQGEDR